MFKIFFQDDLFKHKKEVNISQLSEIRSNDKLIFGILDSLVVYFSFFFLMENDVRGHSTIVLNNNKIDCVLFQS